MLTKNLAPINIMFAGGTLKSTIPYLTERNRAKVVPLASMSYDLSCNTKFHELGFPLLISFFTDCQSAFPNKD